MGWYVDVMPNELWNYVGPKLGLFIDVISGGFEHYGC